MTDACFCFFFFFFLFFSFSSSLDLDGCSISFFMDFSLAHLSDEDLLQLTENVLVNVPPENALYRHLCQKKKNSIRKKCMFPLSQEEKRSSPSGIVCESGDPIQKDKTAGMEEYGYKEKCMHKTTPVVSYASASDWSRKKISDTRSSALCTSFPSASSPLFSSPQHQMDEQISALMHSFLHFPMNEEVHPPASAPQYVSESSTLPSGSSGVSRESLSPCVHRDVDGQPRAGKSAASGSIPPREEESEVTLLAKEIAFVPQEAENLHQEWETLVALFSLSPSTDTSNAPLLSSPTTCTTDDSKRRRSFCTCLHHTITIFHRWQAVLRTHRLVCLDVPARRRHAATGSNRKGVSFSSSTGTTCHHMAALYRQLQVQVLPRGVLTALTPFFRLLEPVLCRTMTLASTEKNDDEEEEERVAAGEHPCAKDKAQEDDDVGMLFAYLVELTPLVWSLLGVLEGKKGNAVVGRGRPLPEGGRGSGNDGENAEGGYSNGAACGSEVSHTMGTTQRDRLSFSMLLPLLWRYCQSSASGVGSLSSSALVSGSTLSSLPSSTAVYVNLLVLALQQWISPFLQSCVPPLLKALHFHFSTPSSSSASSASTLLHPSFFFELWHEQRQHLVHIRHSLLQMLLPRLVPASSAEEFSEGTTSCAEGETLSMLLVFSSSSPQSKAAQRIRSENTEVVISVLCGLADRLLTQRAVSLFTTYFRWSTLVQSVLHPSHLQTLAEEARTMQNEAKRVRTSTTTTTTAFSLVARVDDEEAAYPTDGDVPRVEREKSAREKLQASSARDLTDRRSAPLSSSSSSFSRSSVAHAARAFVLTGMHSSLVFLASLSRSLAATVALLPPSVNAGDPFVVMRDISCTSSHAVGSPSSSDVDVPTLVFLSFSATFTSASLLHRLVRPVALRSLWLQHVRATVMPPPSEWFFFSPTSSSSATLSTGDHHGRCFPGHANGSPSAVVPVEEKESAGEAGWTWFYAQQQAQRRALLLQPRAALRRLGRPPSAFSSPPTATMLPMPMVSSHPSSARSVWSPFGSFPSPPRLREWSSLAEEDRCLRRWFWYPTLHVLRAIDVGLLPLVVPGVLLPSRVAASWRTGGAFSVPSGRSMSSERHRVCTTPFCVVEGEVQVVEEEWRKNIWESVLAPSLLALLRQWEKGTAMNGVGGGGMDGGTSVIWPLEEEEWDLDTALEDHRRTTAVSIGHPHRHFSSSASSDPSSAKGAVPWRGGSLAGHEKERPPLDHASSVESVDMHEQRRRHRRRRWCRAQLDEGNRLGLPFHHAKLFHYYQQEKDTKDATMAHTPLGWWRPARALLVELECLHGLCLAVRHWRVQMGEEASAVDHDEDEMGEKGEEDVESGVEKSEPHPHGKGSRKRRHGAKGSSSSSSPGAVSSLLLALQHEHTLEELFLCCDRGVADCFSVLPSTRWSRDDAAEGRNEWNGTVGEECHACAGKKETHAPKKEEEEEKEKMEACVVAHRANSFPYPLPPPSSSSSSWLVPDPVTNDAWHALHLFLLHGRRAAMIENDAETCFSPALSIYTAAPSGGPAEPLAVLHDVWAMVERRIRVRVQQHLHSLFLPHHRVLFSSTPASATAKQDPALEMLTAEEFAFRRRKEMEEKRLFREAICSLNAYLNQIGCPLAAMMLPME